MRWLILLVIFIAIITAGFHFFFRKSVGELLMEAINIRTVKEALNATVFVFKPKENLQWTLKGRQILFPPNNKILFFTFQAKNIPQNFTISASKAIFLFKEHKVLLKGNVRIVFTKDGNIYVLSTPSAIVYLDKSIIKGNQGVKLVSSGKVLTGQRFYYDYRNGSFEVEGNVTTIFSNK